MPSKLPWHRFKQVAKAAGGTEPLGTVVDEARKGTRTAPSIKDVPKEQLPVLDRYAHGANIRKQLPSGFNGPMGTMLGGIGTAVGGAGYEAAKLIPPPVFNAVAGAFGRPDYKMDSTTSQPSAENVMALLRGYIENPR